MLKKLITTTALTAAGLLVFPQGSTAQTATGTQTDRPGTQTRGTGTQQPGTATQPGQPGTASQPGQTGQTGSQTAGQAGQAGQTRLSNFDRQFLTQAAQTSMAEVELSQLALNRASGDEVKRFAQRMVDDHTRASTRLSQLASSKGVSLPTGLDSKHRSLRQKLEQQSEQAFDHQYLRAMEQDHVKAVELFQRASQKAGDPEIKAFASELLPSLQAHLQEVRGMTAAHNEKGKKR